MKNILIVLGLLLITILQITAVPFINFNGVVPNLILVLILCLIIFTGFKNQWPWVLLAGVLLDLFSGLPFGLISLSLLLTVYLIDLLNLNFFAITKLWITGILIVSGTIIYDLTIVFLSRLFNFALTFSWRYLLGEIIYNLIIMGLFYYEFKKIFHKK